MVSTTQDYGFATCDNEFTYVNCSTCRVIYLRNRPTLSNLELIYPNTYTAYSPARGIRLLQRIRDVVQFFKYRALRHHIINHDAILEVGCGSGELLKVIKKYGMPGHRLVGIDFSEYAARELNENGIEYWRGDLVNFPENDNSFGAVIMNAVIEHVAYPIKTIQKAKKLLRAGGVVYIETPTIGAWDSAIVPLRYWGGWHAPRHFVLFSPKNLTSVLEELGFEVLVSKYIFSPFLWANSLEFYLEHEKRWKALSRFCRISFLPFLCLIGLIELFQLLFTRKTSNFRIIARKKL